MKPFVSLPTHVPMLPTSWNMQVGRLTKCESSFMRRTLVNAVSGLAAYTGQTAIWEASLLPLVG